MSKCSIYERIFNRFDEDGDGKLSPSELRRFVETMGEELLKGEAQELVASMDSDRDGLLGLEEFAEWVEREIRGDEERKMEELKEAFRMYEMDGSKCITLKSLNRMLDKIHKNKHIDVILLLLHQIQNKTT